MTQESGEAMPANGSKVVMVDAALHAIEEIMHAISGSDTFRTGCGPPFRRCIQRSGHAGREVRDHRVYNTAIQEAYIIG